MYLSHSYGERKLDSLVSLNFCIQKFGTLLLLVVIKNRLKAITQSSLTANVYIRNKDQKRSQVVQICIHCV